MPSRLPTTTQSNTVSSSPPHSDESYSADLVELHMFARAQYSALDAQLPG